jgi:hypothetical protein
MPAPIPASVWRSPGCFWCEPSRLASDDTHHYVSGLQKTKETADGQPPIEDRKQMGGDRIVYEKRGKKGRSGKIERQ